MDLPYATVILSPDVLRARRRYAGWPEVVRDEGLLFYVDREGWWDMVYYGRPVSGKRDRRARDDAGGGYNGGAWRLVREGQLVFVVDTGTGEILDRFLEVDPYPDAGPLFSSAEFAQFTQFTQAGVSRLAPP